MNQPEQQSTFEPRPTPKFQIVLDSTLPTPAERQERINTLPAIHPTVKVLPIGGHWLRNGKYDEDLEPEEYFHEAICSCGWIGFKTQSYKHAQADAYAHLGGHLD